MKKPERLQKRLEDWGNWRRNLAHHVGWNVRVIHDEEPVNFQKRNDTHGDPILQEIMRIGREEWRIQTTESAYASLPDRLRIVIYARYVACPDDKETSDTRLADKIGIRREIFRDRHQTALEMMDEIIAGIIHNTQMVC